MNNSSSDMAAQAHLETGRRLHSQGRFEEAERHYLAALKTHPDHPAALHPLAVLCMETGRFEEAAYRFERVLFVRPDLAVALLGLGNALNALGRPIEALVAFGKLRAIDPKNAAAFFGIGHAARSLGRLEESREAFERAVTLAPKCAPYHYALATAGRFNENDPRLAALEELARSEETLPKDQKADLHFALAKAHDDMKHYETAFGHLQKGNAIKRALVSYNETQEMEIFQALLSSFTPEVFAARREVGDPSNVPVFVVGMPRSGTTLVEQILASHPEVFGAGELMDMYKLVGSGYAGTNFPFDISLLSGDALRRFGGLYAARVHVLAPQAKRVVDKLPANFRLIGLIHLALPNARIIHVRRNSRDTCLSCYFNLFSQDINFAYDLAELGRYYKAYETLMAHWRAVLPACAILEVQYEALVDHFEAEARRMVEYCGLEWHEGCLKFHETERVVHTVSAAQIHQPIYGSSVGHWLHYKNRLQPLLDAL
ncbi:MAG: sulfotransferase [Alphaproteobacteria bacterium]|nr:sulfotransferase [Alphaproteobacteria bacterium]MDE2492892.1 sulfotransferase [Alphaproteobacteria bacterium]